MRAANEIDFWRGFALVTIFINHIPGFFYERFTHRNFGLSDSAELFVFLAGWSLRRLADNASEPLGLGRLVLRLGARGVTLYAAQILITMLAIAMIAAAAILLDNALLLDWNNAAAVFQDPVPTHLGLVLLTHQLGYFDILPLYVVLMFGAPMMAVVDRLAPALLLPLSVIVYIGALAFEINFHTWPVEGVWYFDPFAWQLIFVLGFVGASQHGPAKWVRRHLNQLRLPCLAIVTVGAYLSIAGIAPDPVRVPEPKLFFIFDKTYLSPARLIHFLALAITFSGLFYFLQRIVPHPVAFLSMLGRNSLNVFCVGSLLSLGGQLVRFEFGADILEDTLVLIVAVAVLGLTAWLSELRERLRLPSARSASAP